MREGPSGGAPDGPTPALGRTAAGPELSDGAVGVATPHPLSRPGRAGRAPIGQRVVSGATPAEHRDRHSLPVTILEGAPLNLPAAAAHYARFILDALRTERMNATACAEASADACVGTRP